MNVRPNTQENVPEKFGNPVPSRNTKNSTPPTPRNRGERV